MRLQHGIHFGYCTNIHRGETWAETFAALQGHTDAVRRRVAPDRAYGIGLRLSARAAAELSADAAQRDALRRWLDETQSYVFTINGFPYGAFHGRRVKEQVFAPDWAKSARLDYTRQLIDLIDELAPGGMEVSVSTLPGSFKGFLSSEGNEERISAIHRNLRSCAEHMDRVSQHSGRDVHLDLEPEPLGLFENSQETVDFFSRLLEGSETSERERLRRTIGVNYDTCHLAIEFEEPREAVQRLHEAGIRIGKVHLSSALKLRPTPEGVERLQAFEEGVYFHQVLVAAGGQVQRRFPDLPEALAWYRGGPEHPGEEWRVHFHVPLHASPEVGFGDTRDHLSGLLAYFAEAPGWCRHFEFETYTWEVLPPSLRSGDVVDQLVAEYEWCLAEMDGHGLSLV